MSRQIINLQEDQFLNHSSYTRHFISLSVIKSKFPQKVVLDGNIGLDLKTQSKWHQVADIHSREAASGNQNNKKNKEIHGWNY